MRSLATAPSMEGLLLRIWRYLNETERGLLMTLAVFRGAAPADAWPEHATLIEQLHARNLVSIDSVGGIALSSHIHHFVTERIWAEAKPALHLRAAAIREMRGEFVEAMYHYLEGGQPALSVWLWQQHSVAAIGRGQAGTALLLLQRIAPSSLAHLRDRETLHIARGALLRLLGKAEEAESDLHAVITSDDPHLRGEAHMLLAVSLEEQGRIEQAQAQYHAGLQWVSKNLQYQKTRLHARLSRLNLYRLGDLAQARDQSLRARVESLIFSGQVEDQTGNYAAAEAHFTAARLLVENTNPDQLAMMASNTAQENFLFEKSRIYAGLGVLCWRQNNAAAVQWLEQANRCDEICGDVYALAQNHVSLSGAYIIGGQYEQAIASAQRGLAIAEPLQAAFTLVGLVTNAAEASFYLGRFADAEHYGLRSLNQEEEYSRPYALTVLGMVRHAQHKFPKATTLLQEAIASAQAIEDKYAEAAAWRALGNAHNDEPNPTAAQAAYAAALSLYQAMALQKEIAELTALLSH